MCCRWRSCEALQLPACDSLNHMMLHVVASASMAATRNAGHHCLLSLSSNRWRMDYQPGAPSCSAIYEVMSLFKNWDSELNHLNSVFSKLMQLNVPRNVRQSSAKSWYAISTSGSRRTKPKSCRTGHYHKTLIPVCPEKKRKASAACKASMYWHAARRLSAVLPWTRRAVTCRPSACFNSSCHWC